MDTAEDALLSAYYSAAINDPENPVVTIEDLEQRYPKIPSDRLASLTATIERNGWIKPVASGGHKVTAKGRERYLDDV